LQGYIFRPKSYRYKQVGLFEPVREWRVYIQTLTSSISLQLFTTEEHGYGPTTMGGRSRGVHNTRAGEFKRDMQGKNVKAGGGGALNQSNYPINIKDDAMDRKK
jgi:hypothetical protein